MRKDKTKGIKRRILSGIVTFALLLTSVNVLQNPKEVKEVKAADTATVNLSILSNSKKIKFTSETKRGNFWQMSLNGEKAFCMDLGKACHRGDSYTCTTNSSYSSDTGSAKEKWLAKIAYYYNKSSRSDKNTRWKHTQVLVWALEEGKTTKNQLQKILSDLTSSASSIMNEIEGYSGITAKYKIYQSGAHNRQKLLLFDADTIIYGNFAVLSKNREYYQDFKIVKKDNKGNSLANVKFTIVLYGKEGLTDIQATDSKGTHTIDMDQKFSYVYKGETNSNGEIILKLHWDLVSQDYAYPIIPSGLTSEQETALRDQIDATIYKQYGDIGGGAYYTKAEVERDAYDEIAWEDYGIEYQIMEEGRDDLLVPNDWKGTLTKDEDGDACIVGGKTVEFNKDTDVYVQQFGFPTVPIVKGYYDGESSNKNGNSIINYLREVKVNVKKVDAFGAPANGAKFQLFNNPECTDATLDINGKTQVITTGADGTGSITFIPKGAPEDENHVFTFYAKEIKASEGTEINPDVFVASNVQYTCKNSKGTHIVSNYFG